MKENAKFKGILLDENDNPIEGSEFIGWNSRSVAVTLILCDCSYQYFLFEKRGPGCPDNVGKYCMPCGYLNWDETLKEAVCRELYEETGLKINPYSEDLKEAGINDSIHANRQNVTVRFLYDKFTREELNNFISTGKINCDTKSRGGEGEECDEIILINAKDFDNYQYAFRHDQIAKEIYHIFH